MSTRDRGYLLFCEAFALIFFLVGTVKQDAYFVSGGVFLLVSAERVLTAQERSLVQAERARRKMLFGGAA